MHDGFDGISRKNLWLKVVRSDNNPLLPVALYLSAIKRAGFIFKSVKDRLWV